MKIHFPQQQQQKEHGLKEAGPTKREKRQINATATAQNIYSANAIAYLQPHSPNCHDHLSDGKSYSGNLIRNWRTERVPPLR